MWKNSYVLLKVFWKNIYWTVSFRVRILLPRSHTCALQYIALSSGVAVPVCGLFGLWPFSSVAVSLVADQICGRSGLWPFSACGHFGCGRFDLWPLWPATIGHYGCLIFYCILHCVVASTAWEYPQRSLYEVFLNVLNWHGFNQIGKCEVYLKRFHLYY